MKLEQSHAAPGVPGDATLIALERQQRANTRTRWAVVGALALGAIVSLSAWLARSSGDAPSLDGAGALSAAAEPPSPPAPTAAKAAEAAAPVAAPQARADEPAGAVDEPLAPAAAAAPADPVAAGEAAAHPQPAVVDSTGSFDVIVEPAGASVVLDGQDLGISPLRVSDVLVGAHRLEIIAPSGYQSYSQDIDLPANERQVFELELEPEPEPELAPEAAIASAGEMGELDETLVEFTSEPVGADVVVIADGQSMHLGPTPVSVRLNRTSSYYAVFTKDGYGVETRSVDMDSDSARVAAELRSKGEGEDEPGDEQLDDAEKALLAAASRESRNDSATPASNDDADAPRRTRSRARRARTRRARSRAAAVTAPKAPRVTTRNARRPRGNTGTLMLGAKPPCQIFVDGKSTGLLTPQRALPLPAGRHRIKLVNREHGIKAQFTVAIKAGSTTRVIRDLTSRM